MARILASFFDDFQGACRSSFGRFPHLIACAFLWTCALSWAWHHRGSNETVHFCERLAMAAAAGIPLSFSLQIFAENSRLRWRSWIPWLALPSLVLYFKALPQKGFEAPSFEILRWLLLLGTLHCAAAVSAHTRGSEAGFWQFNRRLFQGFCVAALHTGVLLAGLELALLSADKLFGFKFDKAYGDLFFFISGCVHPLFFLRKVPADFAALQSDVEHPRGLKAFTQFALAPLVAVFTLILYAYGAKISLSRNWPHGWVALPVLLLSGVGILSFLLLYPLREREDEKWARWFCRWFPKALAPLSVLLLLALRERIGDYGFTEERYLGLVAGGCILLWALVTGLNRRAGIRWWPVFLGAVALLSALGPWSASAVSRASQTARIKLFMTKHGLLVDGKVVVPEKRLRLPQKEFGDFKETLNYIVGRHGVEPLDGFLPRVSYADTSEGDQTGWQRAESIIRHLRIYGASYSSLWRESFTLDHHHSISVEGFKRVSAVLDLREALDWNPTPTVHSESLWLKIEESTLKASSRQSGPFVDIPLEPFYNALGKGGASPAEMSFDWEHEGRSYRFVFLKLMLTRMKEAPAELANCSVLILEK